MKPLPLEQRVALAAKWLAMEPRTVPRPLVEPAPTRYQLPAPITLAQWRQKHDAEAA